MRKISQVETIAWTKLTGTDAYQWTLIKNQAPDQFGDIKSLHGLSEGGAVLFVAANANVDRYWFCHRNGANSWSAESDSPESTDQIGNQRYFAALAQPDWFVQAYLPNKVYFLDLKEYGEWQPLDRDSGDGSAWHSFMQADGNQASVIQLSFTRFGKIFCCYPYNSGYFTIEEIGPAVLGDPYHSHDEKTPFAHFRGATGPNFSLSELETVAFIDDGNLKRMPAATVQWTGRHDLAPFSIQDSPPEDIRIASTINSHMASDGKIIVHVSSRQNGEYSYFITLFNETNHLHKEITIREIHAILPDMEGLSISLTNGPMHVWRTSSNEYALGAVLLHKLGEATRPVIVRFSFEINDETGITLRSCQRVFGVGDSAGVALAENFRPSDVRFCNRGKLLSFAVLFTSTGDTRHLVLVEQT